MNIEDIIEKKEKIKNINNKIIELRNSIKNLNIEKVLSKIQFKIIGLSILIMSTLIYPSFIMYLISAIIILSIYLSRYQEFYNLENKFNKKMVKKEIGRASCRERVCMFV